MSELDKINSVSEEENLSANAQDEFKQSLAALLFAFKDLVGNSTWLSVNGHADGDKFCVCVATEENADKLHKLVVENFTTEG